MVELIEKGNLIEKMVLSHAAHANNTREESLLNRDVRIVMEQQTITTTEIRNKAIDEFVETLLQSLDPVPVTIGEYGIDMVACDFLKMQIQDLAEQLKGWEHGEKQQS